MKVPLFKQVALLKDYPEQGLTADDIVTTVDFLESPGVDVPNGYFVEAFNALGKTIAVFIVYEDDIEALTEHDVLSKRTIRATETSTPNQVYNENDVDTAHVRTSLPPGDIICFSDEEAESIEDSTPDSATLQPNTVTIELSDSVLRQKGLTIDEAKLHLALALFQQNFFSLGKASEFAGLHLSQFQKELAKRQIPVHYDVDEYQQDIQTLDSHKNSSPTYHEV